MRVFEFLVIFHKKFYLLEELAKWRCCLNVWHFLIFQDTVLSLAISVFMGTCWWPLADTAGQWHTNNLGSSWHKNLFSFTIPPKKSPNDKNMTPQYSNTSWHRQFLFLVFVCSIIEFIWHLPSVVAFWINSFVVIKTTMGPRLRFLMYYSQRCLDLASNEEIFNMDKIIKKKKYSLSSSINEIIR